MNYRYVTHSNNGNAAETAASILEIKTDHYVATNLNVGDAKKMTRHLNFGGGFDGWTPQFFTMAITKTGE